MYNDISYIEIVAPAVLDHPGAAASTYMEGTDMTQPNDSQVAEARARALGASIRRHRGETSQAELADRLSVSQSLVSQWETGVVQVTAEHVIGVERVLGIRSGSLLIEAGYVDESLLGIDSARRFALWKLESAVALLARPEATR